MTERSVELEFKSHKEHILSLLSDEHDNPCVIKVKDAQDADELARIFRTGVLLSLLLNTASKGSVPAGSGILDIDCDILDKCIKKRATESVLTPEETKILFTVTENLNKFIDCAKNAGLVVVNISAEDILEANLDLIFGLTQQIIRLAMFDNVNLLHHPELIRLMKPDENVVKFVSLSDEELIIRWANWHLEGAGSTRRVKALCREEFKDGVILLQLFKRVVPDFEEEALNEVNSVIDLDSATDEQRLGAYINACKLIKCKIIYNVSDLLYGDRRRYGISLAVIFNKYTGIHIPSEEEIRGWLNANHKLARKNEELTGALEEMKSKLKLVSQSCEETMDSLSNVKLSHSELEYAMREEEKKLNSALEQKAIKCAQLEELLKERELELNSLVSRIVEGLSQLKKKANECYLSIYSPGLPERVASVLSKSQLSMNFGKGSHPISPKAPTPTESTANSLDKNSMKSDAQITVESSDFASDEDSADKCLKYISSIDNSITQITDVGREHEKNLSVMLERLDKLSNINNLMTQKICEYTESRMHIKKG